MPQTGQFRELQSGDPVRLTLSDQTILDCSVRRFVGDTNTIIVTTPLGEDDPTLQTTYYIDEYVQMVFPIPAVLQNTNISLGIGDSVEVRFALGGQGTVVGTVTAIDPRNSIVEVSSGGDSYIFKDFNYIKKL